MKKIAFVTASLLISSGLMASGGNIHLEPANVDLSDHASLQKGAKTFVNYCLGCHGASFMRYSRVAKDLGLSEDEVKDNLMFNTSNMGDPMNSAMPKAESAKWFGTAPPDLSVITRARGSDWLYTYLKSFYLDPSRPLGVNNLVFKDVGMPHVLWELQGYAEPVFTEAHHEGAAHKTVTGTKVVAPGSKTPEEYNQIVHDLVNFMTYMGEPSKADRLRLGPWVMLFLALLTVLAYLLKKEYWRGIH
jgi:ubiquinol-cytochrome c reductase cytochrome c1 subunit